MGPWLDSCAGVRDVQMGQLQQLANGSASLDRTERAHIPRTGRHARSVGRAWSAVRENLGFVGVAANPMVS